MLDRTGRSQEGAERREAAAEPGSAGREPAPSCLEPYRVYIAARFDDDPHLLGSVLHQELAAAGFERAYTTMIGELRRLELRPVCKVCQHRPGRSVTIEIEHPPGEEIQWDWLELSETPWR